MKAVSAFLVFLSTCCFFLLYVALVLMIHNLQKNNNVLDQPQNRHLTNHHHSATRVLSNRETLFTTTYTPGQLTVEENNLILSSGLSSKVIAQSKRPVQYANGSESKTKFHSNPDGAAVFSVKDGLYRGGWIYISNSEIREGGVGAVTFNQAGEVVNYDMVLKGTQFNCGGGKTYWETFITCEENKFQGQVYEVNPFTSALNQRDKPTVIGGSGGSYESFAYDARDRSRPTFYVTNDHSRGGLVRFTPDRRVVEDCERNSDYSKMLHTNGKLDYLVLNPISGRESDTIGKFQWVTDREIANSNAKQFYRNAEGIDSRSGFLYFTTKKSKSLFILDLDNLSYTRSSTLSGSFDGEPDQIARIIANDTSSDMLYFCEEASSSNGIHARDVEGNVYTILTSRVRSETTGLAFSPDKRHMYFALQQKGLLFDITRNDGNPFGAQILDVKHK